MYDSGNTAMATTSGVAAAVSPALDSIKQSLRAENTDTAWRSWIAPIGFSAFAGGTLTLSVPTRFVRDWVRTHYADRIQKLWSAETGDACLRVEYDITGAAAPLPNANENKVAEVVSFDISAPLDPRFTFAHFVTGDSNRLAAAAAQRLAAGETAGISPLFLHGAVGLGKTHLLQAAAHELRARGKRVVYLSAEKFMQHFVRALRARDTLGFKDQFRHIDVLMVDDIQFLCGKESTQQELFHTFSALIEDGRQVVFAADRSPADLPDLDARLQSRLGMGLVARIDAPDEALRLGILKAKCAMMQRAIADDVLSFLGQRITAGTRELEGALNRLIAHADMMGRDITVDSAADILQDLLRRSDRKLSVEDIQRQVAEYYNLRLADLLSPRRARPLARPRQVAMYLSKALTEFSLPDIGRRFAGRDHTTIIHGIRKIEELMQSDAALRRDVEALKTQLSAA